MIKAMKQTLGIMKEHRANVKLICRQRCEKLYDLCDSQKESPNYETFKKYYKDRIRTLEKIEMFHDMDLYLPYNFINISRFNKYKAYIGNEQLLSESKYIRNITDKFCRTQFNHFYRMKKKYSKTLSQDFITELAIDVEAEAMMCGITKQEYYLVQMCGATEWLLNHDQTFLLEVELELIPEYRNLSFDTIQEIKEKYPNQLKDEIGEKLYNLIP